MVTHMISTSYWRNYITIFIAFVLHVPLYLLTCIPTQFTTWFYSALLYQYICLISTVPFHHLTYTFFITCFFILPLMIFQYFCSIFIQLLSYHHFYSFHNAILLIHSDLFNVFVPILLFIFY